LIVPAPDKLPVFRAVARAYGFTTGNLATIIGLIWLPLLLLAGGAYFLAINVISILERLSSSRMDAIEEIQRTGFVFYYFLFGVIFLYSVMVVPVMRQALGLREGGAFIHFGLRASEFRTFAALFLLYLVITTVNIVGVYAPLFLFIIAELGSAAIATAAGIAPAVATGSIAIIVWLAYICASTYVGVRLSFFVVPVTVAENRIDLIRAWNLTRGRFWRLFWILFAIRVPLAIAGSAFALAILAFYFGAWPMFVRPNPANAKSAVAVFEMVRHVLPVFIGIAVFLEPLRLGLESGAGAAAYRALEPSAVPDQPAGNSAVQGTTTGDLRSNDLAQADAAS
jgi:hypothetical protein